tara:strand:+ start:812 stop:2224 length:1413 start_codon:yes stop_codon:yes gene_type:complete
LKQLAFLAVAGLLCAQAFAASGQHALTPDRALRAAHLMQQAMAGNIAYEVVSSLTTEVGPRLAGSEAEARARSWAVQKLNALGFANVRVEPFEVPLWQRGVERASILSPYPQPLVVTALGGSVATPTAGVRGEIVAFPTLQALQAVPENSLRGRIAFVDEVMARSRDGSGYGVAVGKRRHAAYSAARAGASAVLIRSVGTNSHRFAHAGQMRRSTEPGEKGVPAAALSAPDADQLQRALALGEPVEVQLVLTPQTLPPAESGNVVAEIVGREAPEEIVLVSAHLDSWDLGTGAVDDAAGVGIVLGAAKLLMDQLEQPPRRTLRIVLFGSEEVGLVGARAYAERHAASLDQHILAAESDFGAGDIWRFDTRVAQERLPAMAAIGEILERLDIAMGNNSAQGGPDMKYLREAGVPVVELLQDGSDYFDLHHTANDTLDKIAPDALDQNVAAYAALLYLVADSEVRFRAPRAD